jgi:hypothetical protein
MHYRIVRPVSALTPRATELLHYGNLRGGAVVQVQLRLTPLLPTENSSLGDLQLAM